MNAKPAWARNLLNSPEIYQSPIKRVLRITENRMLDLKQGYKATVIGQVCDFIFAVMEPCSSTLQEHARVRYRVDATTKPIVLRLCGSYLLSETLQQIGGHHWPNNDELNGHIRMLLEGCYDSYLIPQVIVARPYPVRDIQWFNTTSSSCCITSLGEITWH